MAKKYGIENPPNAGGGCLLTDPAFGLRAKDLFAHIETPTINDVDLLKVGRQFRLDKETKLVVGRNKDENEMIKAIALPNDILLESRDHMGPVSILRGKNADKHIEFASSVTLRYSDAPRKEKSYLIINKDKKKDEIIAEPATEESYLKFRI
jgi:hypothetical protein